MNHLHPRKNLTLAGRRDLFLSVSAVFTPFRSLPAAALAVLVSLAPFARASNGGLRPAPAVPPAAPGAAPTSAADAALVHDFDHTVRPFLSTYCVSCHGGAKPEAELDLSAVTSVAGVLADAAHWDRVMERLAAGEMPPDKAPKYPNLQDRQAVVNWVQSFRQTVAAKNAGDPGLVLARRLSNSEYDYTIHDLTGVDLRPAKEFPVDPANQAGFDNSGESLAMSPSMVKKYLDAARSVADHLVFTPTGFEFAPYPIVTDEDRDKFVVNRIVDFYKAQKLGYTEFFVAAWRYQHRAELGYPDASLAELAAVSDISAKYLGKIYDLVTGPAESVGPIAVIQDHWSKLPAPVAGKEPATLRPACTKIRDFIVELRPFVAQEFANLPARGIASGSQTVVLWKDQQYAKTRMTYPTGQALTVDMSFYASTEPLMLIPATTAADARARYEAGFQHFCALFPDGFFIPERARMFLTNPNDIASDLAGHRLLSAGFHSQMGFFRDDAPLYNLVLDDRQQATLDRMWRELDFISDVPVRQYKQFMWFERGEPPSFMFSKEFNGFRPEDGDITSEARIKALGALYTAKAIKVGVTGPALQAVKDYFVTINANIRALEAAREAAEPRQLQALMSFASRAYRRPLTPAEQDDLLAFYESLRAGKLTHEDALRDSLVSVLMAPNFCYRIDLVEAAGGSSVDRVAAAPAPPPGTQPLSDYALASRLSYFLWSSMPDTELLSHAAVGDLHQPAVLAAQAHRMLEDRRMQNFATEFGGNWLDFRRFEETNTVDRERFPEFTNDLREAMFQEPVRFLTHVVQHDAPVLDLVYGNYTFVNPLLAKHYGIPVPANTGADMWFRVDGADQYGRGGLLPMAAFLTKFAPGLRTSPVKRGHWVVTKILGETIPAPPPNVPVLPTDEKKLGDLTLAQALARHHTDPNCAGCHVKFDSFGLVFEGYGPVGERRAKDLADRPVQINATFPDGTDETGLSGLRDYLHTKVQGEFVDNLCRKLASYALGRTLGLSDDSLIADMKARLVAHDYHFSALVESLVTSPQFLNKRVSAPPPAFANN